MSKYVVDAIMDAALDAVAAATLQSITSDVDTPVDLTNSLCSVAMASGDYAKAQGDSGPGSRKLTMAAKLGVNAAVAGTPLHSVLSLAGVFKLVTTCSGPDITVGSTVDLPSWSYEITVPQ